MNDALSKSFILTINGGSSSLKFALFQLDGSLTRVLTGKVERIGLEDAQLSFTDLESGNSQQRVVVAPDHASCVEPLLALLQSHTRGTNGAIIAAVAHRVVHGGMRYAAPAVVNDEMLAELRRISPFDPEHMPAEINLIEAFSARLARVPQIACFDTAFHQNMPRVAKLLPIPRRYDAQGVRRYGFHGLSYAYLMAELERIAGKDVANGRVILAHLGNGASMAAVHSGRSVDTTMAFTPAAGLAMSTRSGDLDPGLVAYFARTEGMSPERFHHMVNAKSGLLGVSEISPDVRDLLASEANDPRAAEALALFCYIAKKWIGAFAAALGGLDTLVFAGGIGENSSIIRARICSGLEFLGVELDKRRNDANAPIVSKEDAHTTVRVINTDEEAFMADAVVRLLQEGKT